MIKKTIGYIKDFFYPPLCQVCKKPVDVQGLFCPSCWVNMDFIQPPYCDMCGFPFDYTTAEDFLCGPCLKKPPFFSQSRSLWYYGGTVREMILALKHGDQTLLAPLFAKWLWQQHGPWIQEHDYIIPVPLHWRRLWYRRYNQAALIGKELSHLSRIPQKYDLKRIRSTHPQGEGRLSRQDNVKKAFQWTGESLENKRVLLIDDVYTSGSTLNSCAKELKKHKCNHISTLTLARVIKGIE
jgi:ComF family protein